MLKTASDREHYLEEEHFFKKIYLPAYLMLVASEVFITFTKLLYINAA